MTVYSSVEPSVVERVRRERLNVNATAASRVVATGGEPVRCCLDDAEDGQELLLVSVDLGLPGASPHATRSPVYLHAASGCTLGSAASYPAAWRERRQVVRGYDARGWIVDAVEHPGGAEAEDVVADLLARDGVVEVLSSNPLHGCFMLRTVAR